ncbi:aspartate/glutamate racemase family protein [Marinicella sp. W31]|uniref:aspartate/glutamate racemase family protein n=1 Tax=Marinicella sp. W31 TaxID=3023713 RepID=UPI00375771FF
MQTLNNMQHIGIVGCSAEGAALCYKTICIESAQYLEPYDHPQVSMHTLSLADYVQCIQNNDWDAVGELMLNSARKLTAAGADFLLCPDNTIHQAFDYVRPRSELPWLHIAEVVSNHALACGYQRIGITGTQWLVMSEVYPQKLQQLGLKYLRPTEAESVEMNRIIMEELVCGHFFPESTAYFQSVITRMKASGCDAVVLGCTEIPLIINADNSPLPILDSTRLLAQAAIKKALIFPNG